MSVGGPLRRWVRLPIRPRVHPKSLSLGLETWSQSSSTGPVHLRPSGARTLDRRPRRRAGAATVHAPGATLNTQTSDNTTSETFNESSNPKAPLHPQSTKTGFSSRLPPVRLKSLATEPRATWVGPGRDDNWSIHETLSPIQTPTVLTVEGRVEGR